MKLNQIIPLLLILCVRCLGYRNFWELPLENKYATTLTTIQPYLADTGLTGCYNSISGQACGDALYPRQDGDLVNVPSARSYTGPTQHPIFTSDYVTTDNLSGLVWKSCTEGLSGSTCSGGTVLAIDWATATGTVCSSLNSSNGGMGYAGRSDWRLPSIAEVKTLRNYAGNNPATDSAFFPNTLAEDYWSSTSNQAVPAEAWKVSFVPLITSGASTILKTGSVRVRCVSGPQLPINNKADNGDGTITDLGTKLVWQKCSMGQVNDASCSGSSATADWQNSLIYCANLTLGQPSLQWRLPNIHELASAVDYTATNPSISVALFPNSVSAPYWSSTTFAGTNSAWWVDFASGAISDGCCALVAKSNTYSVRCVASSL